MHGEGDDLHGEYALRVGLQGGEGPTDFAAAMRYCPSQFSTELSPRGSVEYRREQLPGVEEIMGAENFELSEKPQRTMQYKASKYGFVLLCQGKMIVRYRRDTNSLRIWQRGLKPDLA